MNYQRLNHLQVMNLNGDISLPGNWGAFETCSPGTAPEGYCMRMKQEGIPILLQPGIALAENVFILLFMDMPVFWYKNKIKKYDNIGQIKKILM